MTKTSVMVGTISCLQTNAGSGKLGRSTPPKNDVCRAWTQISVTESKETGRGHPRKLLLGQAGSGYRLAFRDSAAPRAPPFFFVLLLGKFRYNFKKWYVIN